LTLTTGISGLASFDLTLQLLPVSGTYRIAVDPTSTNTGSANVNVTAGSASLLVNGTAPVTGVTASASGNVTVAPSGGPANTTDWVALAAIGTADNSYLDWQYLNGTKSAPSTGSSSATLTFAMPSTLGTYVFRFFANNGFGRLAFSTNVTVISTASLQVNSTSLPNWVTVGPRTNVTVSVSSGPGNTTDWVELVPVGTPDSGFIEWQYLNGSQTAPSSGSTSATLTFTTPAGFGNYEFRFFANNGYTRLAISPTVTVTSP
jgi:hypothetical protein